MDLCFDSPASLTPRDTTVFKEAITHAAYLITTLPESPLGNRAYGLQILALALHMRRAARGLLKAAIHNRKTERKLNMLRSPLWRARVLCDLGGDKALIRWERLMQWRRHGKPKDILRLHASPAQRMARTANLLKARAALRKKAYRSDKAFFRNTHPNVLYDKVKVDQEGEFRLAPIVRGPRKRVAKQATQAPKMRAVKSVKITYTKIDPIPVWPIEFRAAEKLGEDWSCEDETSEVEREYKTRPETTWPPPSENQFPLGNENPAPLKPRPSIPP